MAVPTIAATATTTETSYNSSDWSIDLTGLGTVATGDLLLGVVGFAVGAVRNWSAPSGWTRLSYNVNGAADRELYVIAKDAAGGETSATWAKSGANGGGSACLYRIAAANWYGTVANGVEAVDPAVNSGGDDPPNLAPSWGTSEEHLWLVGIVINESTTISAFPTNYSASQLTATNVATVKAAAAAYTNKAASSSENPGAFTLSVGGSTLTTICVRPSAGASGAGKIASRHLAAMRRH